MLTLTIILGVLFVIAFIIVRVLKGGFAALILKIFASIFFIFTALVASYEYDMLSYGIYIIIALIFGLIGDILLDLKWMYTADKSLYLLSGFIAFMFGHVGFLTALIIKYDFYLKITILPLIISLIISVIIILMEKPMKLKYGKFKAISAIYSFLLVFVTSLSGFLTINNNPLFFIGLVMFLLSDVILSTSYFGENKNTAPMIASNHLLYYGAQYLIAYSIILYPF